jgi:hypothetical protein
LVGDEPGPFCRNVTIFFRGPNIHSGVLCRLTLEFTRDLISVFYEQEDGDLDDEVQEHHEEGEAHEVDLVPRVLLPVDADKSCQAL